MFQFQMQLFAGHSSWKISERKISRQFWICSVVQEVFWCQLSSMFSIELCWFFKS